MGGTHDCLFNNGHYRFAGPAFFENRNPHPLSPHCRLRNTVDKSGIEKQVMPC